MHNRVMTEKDRQNEAPVTVLWESVNYFFLARWQNSGRVRMFQEGTKMSTIAQQLTG